ncbi:IS66 family transposase [Cyclobacterium xiamenense]|uniref:IS66 family transposase n=1 Tax=Cyclobacterium xiamenense TaxID=1297121 RepID=UPI0012BA33E2|nr:IS66 family transposase [Cyclobacterium xiamenense]
MQNQPEIITQEDYLSLQKDLGRQAGIITELKQKNAYLEAELAALKRMVFGSKQERFIPGDNGQLTLGLHPETMELEEEEPIQVNYSRKKKKRKAVRLELPAHLPRQSETIEPEGLDSGAKKIGESITEILEYTPGKIFVKQYIRPRYVQTDSCGDQTLRIGKLPSLPIPQGNAGPGLLAHLMISKFIDHLPYYRQVQQFKRQGVTLAESTISGWFSATCTLLTPLYELLCEKTLKASYLHADETPLPVQSSEKKGATHTGYHWVYRAPEERLVCFDYRRNRGREGPELFLQGFQGALQTDGYAAYEVFSHRKGITLLACMAHARRYFEKALSNDAKRAKQMLVMIQKLYAIERKAKEAGYSHQQRYYYRKRMATRILKKMEKWMRVQSACDTVLPKSGIGKALSYTQNLWPRLKRYKDNGAWEIDNNQVENSIRPVALGRKNYLFAGSHQAAEHAAMMYSFFGTCKLNGIEPYQWLKDTLNTIADARVNDLEKYLPIKQEEA